MYDIYICEIPRQNPLEQSLYIFFKKRTRRLKEMVTRGRGG
jgi:hypothetical protein